jgi:hypothetical protein
MNSRRITLMLVAIFNLLSLAACGGSGGASNSPPVQTVTTSPPPVVPVIPVAPVMPNSEISGIFDGTLGATEPMTAILQADGSYFLVYSNAQAPQQLLGAIVGTGTLSNGSFTSQNGLDLNLDGSVTQAPQAVTLSANFIEQQSLNGSFNFSPVSTTDAPSTFTATYNSSYAALPSLASLAGTYTTTIATVDLSEINATLTIHADGTLTGQLSCGCTINATLTPRADGMAYVANLSMVGGDHILSNKTVAGNVYLDTNHNRLYIVGNIVGTSEQVIFVGAKN